MKYIIISALFLVSFSVSGKGLNSGAESKNKPASNAPVQWDLVWEDNFDVAGLPNSKIWSYEEGYVRNNEAQYYTKERSENARVEDGKLIIEARNDNWNSHKITAASINTNGKKSILYGRIEVKAKLPTGVGTWPAIWMLGDAMKKGTGWPACGEIDIMENVGYDPDVIHANIHTKAYNHVKNTNKGNKITIAKPYNDFHVYAVEWFEDHMDFFVDDQKYFTFPNEKTGNDVWPFDKPHYLLINLAIGGGWGGQEGVDDKIFPQKYYIDYVKIFKQKE
jgi:beta-glucanase (GH16 family)